MTDLIDRLKKDNPSLKFKAGAHACWSPLTKQIFYKTNSNSTTDAWGLLHELGHALLRHNSYTTDIGLLRKEVAAWDKADVLAQVYGLKIKEDYKQNCLETYRNWLYKRSSCPKCGTHGLQRSESQYYCINCLARWAVSSSRFCRPYRGYNRYVINNIKESTT